MNFDLEIIESGFLSAELLHSPRFAILRDFYSLSLQNSLSVHFPKKDDIEIILAKMTQLL